MQRVNVQRVPAAPAPGVLLKAADFPLEQAAHPGRAGAELQQRPRPRVLAVIPARGGSKGIPRKNIQPVCGKPLLGYAVEVALAAPNIDAVVVSTDDAEVAEIARAFGAEVPFLRPAAIAGDQAEISQAVAHTRQALRERGRVFDAVVTIYPTQIFRSVSLVTELTDLLLGGYGLVLTAKRVWPGAGGYFTREEGLLRPLPDRHAGEGLGFLRVLGSFVGTNYCCYRTPRRYVRVLDNPLEILDIDHWRDLYMAEEVIRRGLYDFRQ